MINTKIKTIRVAAVQMVCEPGQAATNLKHAEALVQEAVSKGAQLVLLPELMPSGYMTTEAIWDYAETMEGTSVQWLKNTAKAQNIYLGFSFLEAEGEHFYNAFVLATPQGRLAGRVRKTPPASIEANFYTAGNEPHIIETELGRIGVGICYENLLYDRICELAGLSVDLVLSPSAAGRPKPILPKDVQRLENTLKHIRHLYAETLGVPNVFANRVGALETELPGMLPYLKSSFPGLSSISDANGIVLAELVEEEGVIIADIVLDPSKKKVDTPKKYGKMWSTPVPWYAFLWPMTQKTGEKAYAKNPRRPIKARAISQTKHTD